MNSNISKYRLIKSKIKRFQNNVLYVSKRSSKSINFKVIIYKKKIKKNDVFHLELNKVNLYIYHKSIIFCSPYELGCPYNAF